MKNGLLIILDGYGEGKKNKFNAVDNANTPTLKYLRTLSHSLLDASGEAVGLFDGELGGSEVGHLTIGAGRIVPSTVKKIDNDINSGKFKKNKVLLEIFNEMQKNNANLHLIGMMSDKNVHSNINHAYQVIDMAKSKVNNIFLHLITDGRDTDPFDSEKYYTELTKTIANIKNCEVASISGRAWAMDRENNLDRTQKAYNAMFGGSKTINSSEVLPYLKKQHDDGVNDQFIEPVHVKTKAKFAVNKKDVLFFFNFREDRLRQIVKMCENLKCKIITMAAVNTSKTIQLYPVTTTTNTICEHFSNLNLKQIKISESTKYAHLTYFFNGGREEPFKGEERIHILSNKVEDFATTPKMKAKEIADETVKAIKAEYNAIFVNFSNPDMLGHTGNYEATVKSLEFLDKCVKRVIDAAIKKDYAIIVTADHGNAEVMRTLDGLPHMAHTLNKVMCVALGKSEYKMKKFGGLKDIAPTMLDLMGLEKFKAFEGKSLILHK